jgi:hypothetical protein
VPAGTESATIVEPNGERHPVPVTDGRAIYAGTRCGFHTLVTGAGEEVFAANLAADLESDVKPANELTLSSVDPRSGAVSRTAGEVSGGRIGVRREIWIYMVLLVLLMLTIEWLTYHRRWTV